MLVGSNDLDWAGSSPGDPLDPSFVGETMDMPMDMELINEAKAAGIIKESNPLYKSVSSPSATYLGSTPPAGAGAESYEPTMADTSDQVAQNVNVTGPWSLDLIALDQILRHLDIALVQNKDAIIGHGVLTGGNDSQRVIASGFQTGDRLSLTVMPINNLDLYKLDLSLDLHTTGTYTAYSSSGATWSGDIAGTAPVGILVPVPKAMGAQKSAEPKSNTAKKAAATQSGPIRLGKGI